MYQITTATKKIANLKKRIRAIQGGTSSSKTISILLYLIHLAQSDKKPTLSSVVSESMPHLKRGAVKDFLDIMQTHKYFNDNQWNKSSCTYTFETKSKIEFFSADQPTKVRGPRRERLFMNEVNNMPYETFDQLEIRTKEVIFLDWNPTTEFWFYDQVKDRGDVDHIILNYRDNEALDNEIIKTIEQRKGNKNWWRVYGEGQLGESEGLIYTGWNIIDEIPHEARLELRGLDFGYSVDPTAIIEVYKYNEGYILNERVYQKGLSNKQIADILLGLEEQNTTVIADSAEPKSIDEIRSYGVNILPAEKGQGSINQGIQFVQDQKISVTKRSINLIKEYRNYTWKTDKNGKMLQIPEDYLNDCLDATRYALSTKNINRKKEISRYIPKYINYD